MQDGGGNSDTNALRSPITDENSMQGFRTRILFVRIFYKYRRHPEERALARLEGSEFHACGHPSRRRFAAPQDDGSRAQYTSCWNRPVFLSSATKRTASSVERAPNCATISTSARS